MISLSLLVYISVISLPPVSRPQEVEVDVQDAALKCAAEAALVRVLPLLIHNPTSTRGRGQGGRAWGGYCPGDCHSITEAPRER